MSGRESSREPAYASDPRNRASVLDQSMADTSDLVAQFIAFTGVEDAGKAMQMLEATNHDIQAAVELYFAAHADAPGGSHVPNPANQDQDLQHARDLQEALDAQEAQVRAPIPTKVDRLVGSPGLDRREQRHRRQQREQQASHLPIMDAFRARREESMVSAAGAGTSNAPATAPVDAHWADQFEPPRTVVFDDGDCEDAAMAARESKKWLVVNIQSPSSFDSHRLNRDVWKDDAMQAMLPVSFVLYQTYDVSEEGQELAGGWGVTEFPVILVVDPVTGAPMKKWHGFVPADVLIEELVPFMDTNFDDPEAASLFKKRAPGRRMGRVATGGMERTGAMGMGGSVLERAMSSVPTSTAAADDDADMDDLSGMDGDVGDAGDDGDDGVRDSSNPRRGAVASKPQLGDLNPGSGPVDVAAVRREAASLLPEEPSNEEKPCRLALRLPDGTRVQRKFPPDTPLCIIKAWCTSLSDEAAGGRLFTISESIPGATPIDLDAPEQTIGGAGIAGVMLGVKWQETS